MDNSRRSGSGRLTTTRRRVLLAAVSAGALAVPIATALPAHAAGDRYAQVNYLSDIPGVARGTDPDLVNPWGLSASPTGPLWVSDNGTDVSTLYTGGQNGGPLTKSQLVVKIPGGAPTGTVFNPGSQNNPHSFPVHSGRNSAASVFLFASEAGFITGWAPTVPPPPPSRSAQVAIHVPGAVFKGLGLFAGKGYEQLYATDFAHGRVLAWGNAFQPILRGRFVDPFLPAGYAPFGIQVFGNRVYVTYAVRDPATNDDVAGPGKGLVSVFTTDGRFVRRLVSNGALNAPWGMVIAPAGFGAFSGDLLVGNFGDGRINAYDRYSGAYRGTLKNIDGAPLEINGLWGLIFGNAAFGDPHTLFFSAGIADEEHGLLGALRPTP